MTGLEFKARYLPPFTPAAIAAQKELSLPECGECNGRGWMMVSLILERPADQKYACPACGGSGKKV
jgi:DnaJ-class molecular chaperone